MARRDRAEIVDGLNRADGSTLMIYASLLPMLIAEANTRRLTFRRPGTDGSPTDHRRTGSSHK